MNGTPPSHLKTVAKGWYLSILKDEALGVLIINKYFNMLVMELSVYLQVWSEAFSWVTSWAELGSNATSCLVVLDEHLGDGWWLVTITSMVSDHPWDGGWQSCYGWWPSWGKWVNILGKMGDHQWDGGWPSMTVSSWSAWILGGLTAILPESLLFPCCTAQAMWFVAQAMWDWLHRPCGPLNILCGVKTDNKTKPAQLGGSWSWGWAWH